MHSAPDSIINWRFTVASSGQQDFCVYCKEFPVSEPIIKQSAFLQATGEAKYTQDVHRLTHHLDGVYILNMGRDAQACANFKIAIPSSFKQDFPDVVDVFTAEDIGALCDNKINQQGLYPRNDMGQGQSGFPGDTIFAQGEVDIIGHITYTMIAILCCRSLTLGNQ